jgi:uncharacterized membrane protein YbaN (DUF454 family)
MRTLYLLAGFVFLGLAIVGAVLPVMPSTIFVILAAGCFARSSPRLERMILEHPVFGPALVRWRERGAISPAAKAMAVAGMSVGYVVFLATARPGVPALIAVGAIIAGCGVYVLTRPDA